MSAGRGTAQSSLSTRKTVGERNETRIFCASSAESAAAISSSSAMTPVFSRPSARISSTMKESCPAASTVPGGIRRSAASTFSSSAVNRSSSSSPSA